MRASVETAVDGRRLVSVTFTPEVPNPAQQPEVEVVLEVEDVPTYRGMEAFGLIFLSVTSTDTREPYVLSRTQRKAVVETALSALEGVYAR